MRLTKRIASAFLISGVLLAQTADTKQPKLKSEKEQQAVMAIFNAAEPAARITATDALITKFADTEFKSTALYIATASAEEVGDWEKTVIYGERTLEADPKSYGTMLILARGYASRTKEFDFDKEEKLTKADKLAKNALELLKTAPKIRPDIQDDQSQVSDRAASRAGRIARQDRGCSGSHGQSQERLENHRQGTGCCGQRVERYFPGKKP